MTKEKLKRLKSSILALIMCLTLNGCSKEESTEETINEETKAVVIFIQGKALIYSGEYEYNRGETGSSISDPKLFGDIKMGFSQGIEVVKVINKNEAIELATGIVGEENVMILELNGADLTLKLK